MDSGVKKGILTSTYVDNYNYPTPLTTTPFKIRYNDWFSFTIHHKPESTLVFNTETST